MLNAFCKYVILHRCMDCGVYSEGIAPEAHPCQYPSLNTQAFHERACIISVQ